MNKEEILRKSREENKNGDERDIFILRGSSFPVIITIAVVSAVMMAIEAIFLDGSLLMDGLSLQIALILAVQHLYLLITLKKKSYIITLICFTALSVLNVLNFIDTVISMA